MMSDTNEEAAPEGTPERTVTVGNLNVNPSMAPRRDKSLINISPECRQ